MANYPGTSGGVRANISFDTGEAALWSQVANVGTQIGRLGAEFNIQQAQIQLQDSILKAEGEMLRLSNSLNQNTDEDTYHRELDNSISTINQFRPKNGLAAREYDAWIKRQTPGWREDVDTSIKRRLDDKWNAMIDTLAEDAVKTRSTAKLETELASGVIAGRISSTRAGKIQRDTINATQYQIGMDDALANGRAFLKSISIKDGRKHSSRHPDLEPGQLMALSNIAEGEIGNIARRKRLLIEDTHKELATMAQNLDISPAQAFERIKAKGFDDATENAEFARFLESRNMIIKGLGNPYTTTMNHSRLKDMKVAARNGTLTEGQILDAEGEANGISMQDADSLRKIINGKDIVKNAQEVKGNDLIESIIKRGLTDEDIQPEALEKALQEYDDWRKSQTGPITDRDNSYAAIRIARDVERKVFEGIYTGLEDIWPRSIVTGEDLDKIDLAEIRRFRLRREGKIPHITTKEEFDALESGAEFIAPNGQLRRKQ